MNLRRSQNAVRFYDTKSLPPLSSRIDGFIWEYSPSNQNKSTSQQQRTFHNPSLERHFTPFPLKPPSIRVQSILSGCRNSNPEPFALTFQQTFKSLRIPNSPTNTTIHVRGHLSQPSKKLEMSLWRFYANLHSILYLSESEKKVPMSGG